jgi:predicted deacetylase
VRDCRQVHTKYILRFDDISPAMAWSKFLPLKTRLEQMGVVSVLGVIPRCRDPKLRVEAERPDYFDVVRRWIAHGDTIAQHGTFHVYDSTDSGILGINRRSEFAGHPLSVQLERAGAGKDVLAAEGVWQPWFMAPAHSFDEATLDALSALGFRGLTDGYGFFPYSMRSLTLVPQLTSFPINAGFGYSTICVHVNAMPEAAVARLLAFVERNVERFVDFTSVASQPPRDGLGARALRAITSSALKAYRSLRQGDAPVE